ncbi:MAG: MFS transporter [Planctomycetota bacterium]
MLCAFHGDRCATTGTIGGWRSPAARHYLFGAVLMGFSQAVTWSLLARYLEAHGFNKGEVGDVIASDAIGKALVALPAALWLARRSATTTFMASAFIGGGCYVLLPWIDGYWQLRALNLVAGMSLAVHYVMIAPFLFRHTAETERASIFGLAEATRTLASVVGALVAGGLVAWLMRRWLPGETGVLEGEALRLHNAAEAAPRATRSWARVSPRCWRRSSTGASPTATRRASDPPLRGKGTCWTNSCATGARSRDSLSHSSRRRGLDSAFRSCPCTSGPVPAGTGTLGPALCGGTGADDLRPARIPVGARAPGIRQVDCRHRAASLPFFLLLALSQSLPWAMAAFLLRGALMNSTHPIHKNLMMRATPSSVRELQTGINAILWGLGWYIGPKLGGRCSKIRQQLRPSDVLDHGLLRAGGGGQRGVVARGAQERCGVRRMRAGAAHGLRGLAWGLCGATALVLACSWAARRFLMLEPVSNGRVAVGVLGLFASLALLVRAARQRRRLWAPALAVVLAWLPCGPGLRLYGPQPEATEGLEPGLRIGSINLLFGIGHPEPVYAWMAEEELDVVGFLEVLDSPRSKLRWTRLLESWRSTYPYQEVVAHEHYGMALLSKWPLEAVEARFGPGQDGVESERPVMLRATVQMQGRPLDVYLVHPFSARGRWRLMARRDFCVDS